MDAQNDLPCDLVGTGTPTSSVDAGANAGGADLPVYDWHINLLNMKLSAKGTKQPDYGKLVRHAATAVVHNAVCRVREGGRDRAVRERTRNVHAFVRGASQFDVDVKGYLEHEGVIRVRYNPFLAPFFFCAETGTEVTKAEIVILDHHDMYALQPTFGGRAIDVPSNEEPK